MISDDELSQLSADPELAFVQFEKILRERIEDFERQEKSQGDFNANPYRLQYMNKVHAAAKVYGIEVLAKLHVAKFDRPGSIVEEYRQFTHDVDHVTIQIKLRSALIDRQGSVGLDDITKAKIHHFIKQIGEAIERSDLPEDKRDALYNKLNKFAAEVDRVRTSLQAGMSVYIAICDSIGQGFKKLEPAREWIELDWSSHGTSEGERGSRRAEAFRTPAAWQPVGFGLNVVTDLATIRAPSRGCSEAIREYL